MNICKPAKTHPHLTHATYETSFFEVEGLDGHRVRFGPSRVTVEPLKGRQMFPGERVVDKLLKFGVILAALYLFGEIFHMVSR